MGENGSEWVELKLDVSAEFQAPLRSVLPESGRLFAELSAPTGAGRRGEEIVPGPNSPPKDCKKWGSNVPLAHHLP